MDIKVVALSQEVSFEDSSMTNILLLRLPSGRPLRAVISDASAKMLYEDLASQVTGAPHVTESVNEEPPQPMPQPAHRPAETRPSSTEDGVVEFGGGDDDSDNEPSPAWLPSEEPPAPAAPQEAPKVWTDPDAQARAFREQAAKNKKNVGKSNRGVTVPKNDRGYPMVSNRDGVDVNSVIGGGPGADEEGVGQI